jgi:hypothetical protein
LRGTIALALVLLVPAEIDGVDIVRALVYGIVLCSLLVEGLTISPLVRALRPPSEPTVLSPEAFTDSLASAVDSSPDLDTPEGSVRSERRRAASDAGTHGGVTWCSGWKKPRSNSP